jgi:dTDP-4-amino-4,6-dideoxygalactose transaminase
MNVPLLDLTVQYARIKDDVRAALDEVLESQVFINGPQVKALETAIAAYCGVSYAVGVASGTDALLLALKTMELKPGDEVIVPTFTFFATAGTVVNAGGTPVFVDIEPGSFNIDPVSVERAITSRTRAIVPVHLFGQMAQMEPLHALADRHGLLLLEDAAQAIGAEQRPATGGHARKSCAQGIGGALSFFPSKNLGGYGDGGMFVSGDAAFADKVRMWREHGMRPRYVHHFVGTNSRLDTLQAAVLLVKLRHLDAWADGRRRVAARYDDAFRGTDVIAPPVDANNTHVYHQYVIRVPRRDALQAHLTERGVGNAVYYQIPLHLQACFAALGYAEGSLPLAEQASREVLALPVYPELTEPQIEHVVASVLEFYGAKVG